MEDLKSVIAKNIATLRQEAKMTQSDLAERLNYSDKAISKWERAESMPDITVLKTIADLFEVPLDYLVREEHGPEEVAKPVQAVSKKRNHAVITLLSVLIVWFVAVLGYVVLEMALPGSVRNLLMFVYALPVSAIVWLVLNSVWFNRRRNFLIISLLMWSLLAAVHLTFWHFEINIALIYLLGVAGQAVILLWSRISRPKRQKN